MAGRLNGWLDGQTDERIARIGWNYCRFAIIVFVFTAAGGDDDCGIGVDDTDGISVNFSCGLEDNNVKCFRSLTSIY